LRLSVDLDSGESVRVFGPASVTVERGMVSLLGAELGPGDSVDIGEYRSYLLRALEPSRVSVSIAGEGRIEAPVEGEEHYDKWIEAADAVIDGCGGPGRVVVVGPGESGKTSFAAMLSNRAMARGIISAVVDADVGQADIGPPGFISMAIPGSWVLWLRELEPEAIRFVGTIEPGPVAGRILSSVASLVSEARARGAANIFIDTDEFLAVDAAVDQCVDFRLGGPDVFQEDVIAVGILAECCVGQIDVQGTGNGIGDDQRW